MEAAEKSGKKFPWKREITKFINFFLGLIKDYVKNFTTTLFWEFENDEKISKFETSKK